MYRVISSLPRTHLMLSDAECCFLTTFCISVVFELLFGLEMASVTSIYQSGEDF